MPPWDWEAAASDPETGMDFVFGAGMMYIDAVMEWEDVFPEEEEEDPTSRANVLGETYAVGFSFAPEKANEEGMSLDGKARRASGFFVRSVEVDGEVERGLMASFALLCPFAVGGAEAVAAVLGGATVLRNFGAIDTSVFVLSRTAFFDDGVGGSVDTVRAKIVSL